MIILKETGKIPVFLVLLSGVNFEILLNKLDFSKVELMGVISETTDMQIKMPDGREVVVGSFADLDAFLQYADQDIYWVLYGIKRNLQDITKMSQALQAGGVRKEFIIGYLMLWNMLYWANMKYVKQTAIDCFATGISYAEVGLDLDCLPSWHGVNLAASSQDLYYGMKTAEYALGHDKDHRIKFCLIGLSPYSFLYDMAYSFAARPFCYQYAVVFQEFRKDHPQAAFFENALKPSWKQYFEQFSFSPDEVDIHLSKNRQNLRQDINAQDLIDFNMILKEVSGKYNADVLARNIDHMKAYVALCHEHHVVPIAFVLPFTKLLRRSYPADRLDLFRSILSFFRQTSGLHVIDLFDLELDYSHYYDLTHLNQKGATVVSEIINERVESILNE